MGLFNQNQNIRFDVKISETVHSLNFNCFPLFSSGIWTTKKVLYSGQRLKMCQGSQFLVCFKDLERPNLKKIDSPYGLNVYLDHF